MITLSLPPLRHSHIYLLHAFKSDDYPIDQHESFQLILFLHPYIFKKKVKKFTKYKINYKVSMIETRTERGEGGFKSFTFSSDHFWLLPLFPLSPNFELALNAMHLLIICRRCPFLFLSHHLFPSFFTIFLLFNYSY